MIGLRLMKKSSVCLKRSNNAFYSTLGSLGSICGSRNRTTTIPETKVANVLSFGKIRQLSSESEDAALTLYGFRFSQPTRSVLLLLEANSIPYKFETVDAMKGENRKAPFRNEFPLGLVPAIKMGPNNFRLAETAAILSYLCNSSDAVAASWYPDAPEARAAVDSWMHWHHAHSRMCTKMILHPVLFPKLPGQAEKAAQGAKQMKRVLKILNDALGESKYLCGEDMTIADLLIICEFDQHREEVTGLIDFSPYPNVQRWMRTFDEKKWYQGIFETLQTVKSEYPNL
jgi:glutathione S-transferase